MTIAAVERSLDFYHFDALLTPEERELRERTRAFCDEEVTPIINEYWERGEFPFQLIPKLAQLNLAGGHIKGYGCPGLSRVGVGVTTMELSRGDGSIETFLGVTSGLAMGSIYQCGSEEQKERWLPAMARLEKIGAFGLTEPEVGSDASHIRTTAKRVGDRYVLNGGKRWIGNATFADVTIIWANDSETGKISGFLVEKDTPGFKTELINGKIAKRALLNAQITLENCEIPESNRLPLARSFRDTAQVLKSTRFGVAWEGVGHALAAFDITREYVTKREQFGKPIGSFQLVQQKLVQMLGELTSIQLLAWRVSKLMDEDESQVTEGMASLAKATCAAKARNVVALGRELMGGNGILLENHMARHFADMEAVYTYEGTNEINSLVVGREITGLSAFV